MNILIIKTYLLSMNSILMMNQLVEKCRKIVINFMLLELKDKN